MKKFLTIFLTLIVIQNIWAQNKTAVRVELRDGSSISGTAKIDKVILNTAFGKLDIPAKNISRIKIGIVEDQSQKSIVINLLKQLNSESEATRKNAYENLLKLNAGAIPIIENAIFNDISISNNKYSDYTADAALFELKLIHGIDETNNFQDIVTIDEEFTIGGRYEFSKLELNTDYGNLSIPREKISNIEILYTIGDASKEREFKLIASKHITANEEGGWLKTGIMVKSGQQINISVTGQVTFASLSGSTYNADGKAIGNTLLDDPFAIRQVSDFLSDIEVFDNQYDVYETKYPQYGNVVYKIGENGSIQKAGSKFSTIAKQNGMLYISIYETVYNPANKGSYNVKVSVK